MKKINYKRVLTIFTIGLLILIKIFDEWIGKDDYLGLSVYTGWTIAYNLLMPLAITYIILGFFDLLKDSLKSGICDFISSGLIFYCFYLNNEFMYVEAKTINIVMAITGIVVIANLIISSHNKYKEKEKPDVKSIIKEFALIVIMLLIVTGVSSKSVFNYYMTFKHNVNALVENKNLIEGTEENGAEYIFSFGAGSQAIYSIVDKNFTAMKKYGGYLSTNNFLPLYKDGQLKAVIGIFNDVTYGKCTITNRNLETICEIKTLDDESYDVSYLVDLFGYAINNNLLDYDSFDKEKPQEDMICSDGSELFYKNIEHGYIDTNGEKHVDDDEIFTLGVYEKYIVLYDRNNTKFLICDKYEPENILKECNFAFAYNNYIICCFPDRYEILSPEDLSIMVKVDRTPIEDEEYAFYLTDVEVYDNEKTIFLRDDMLLKGFTVVNIDLESKKTRIVENSLYEAQGIYGQNIYPNSLYLSTKIFD